MWKWNRATSGNQLPAGSKHSPAALYSHPLLILPHQFIGLSSCDDWASLLHFQRAAWCQWRMAAEHRTGRTRNAHMSPWPVSVLALSCISLATTTICTWTQMVIHQMEVFSQQHLSSGAEDGYSGKLWCDLWGDPTFPCCGREWT